MTTHETTHTVNAIFDDDAAALRAALELEHRGLPKDMVLIDAGLIDSAREPGSATLSATVPAEEIESTTEVLNRFGAVLVQPSIRETRENGRRGTHATGLSPHSPAPSVLSGFGSTAGAGTLAGEVTAGSAPDLSSPYRRHFEESFGADSDFDKLGPAYEFGYRNARDERYRGKSWDQAESDLCLLYERENPHSEWHAVRMVVRSGWDKAPRLS